MNGNTSAQIDLIQRWFGEARIQADLQTVHDFWNGRGRYLVSIYASSENYRQNFDLNQALPKALRQLELQARLPGINLPRSTPTGAQSALPNTGAGLFNSIQLAVTSSFILSPRRWKQH